MIPEKATGDDSNTGLKINQVKQLFSEVIIPFRKFPAENSWRMEQNSIRLSEEGAGSVRESVL